MNLVNELGRLIALSSDVTPTEYILVQDKVTIGRLSGICDILISRPTVSRVHTELIRNGSYYTLYNLSRHATYVDGVAVYNEKILYDGNRIGFDHPEPLLLFQDPRQTSFSQSLLTYNPQTLTFFLAGKELPLTPQQFSLLHFLYQHPNQLCSREACEIAVWGTTNIFDINAVHRLISDLRIKFRQIDPTADLIETRRAMGYLLKI